MKESVKNTEQEETYWSDRYQKQITGWDIGYPSEPIKTYID
jgi:methyl halide transferase